LQLTFSFGAFAFEDGIKAPIKIGSYFIPGLIKEDGTGMFDRLNNALFKEIGKETQLTFASMNRARKGITDGTLDVYFPELWENLPMEKEHYVVSRPIFYKRIILFTLAGSGLNKLSDFEKAPLGAVQGFAYSKEIKHNSNLNISYQENDITNIKLLLNNRIGGVLGGYPGTVIAVKKNNADNHIIYGLDKPVAILESFYVCENNADGIQLCNAINRAIESLMQKGVLTLNENTGFSQFSPEKPIH
jgi:polar amino acid transport system substrate-binding protein